MSQEFELDVSFKDEPPEVVADLMKGVGAKEVEALPQRGLTGIETVIFAIIAASALASLVTKLIAHWKCGVIIDARGRKVLTEKNPALPRGSVIILMKDGTKHVLEKPSEFEVAELIKAAVGKG